MKPLLILIFVAFTIPSLVQCRRDREGSSPSVTNYKTDGSERHEELEADGTIKGHYSYVDPTGKKIRVSYSAGKNGFQATGNHFAQFNMGDPKDEYVDETEDDSYDRDTQTFFHKEKPTYQSKVPSYRPTASTNKKSAVSYANQESTHDADDDDDDSDDDSSHFYNSDSSNSQYKQPSTSYKAESPKYQSYNPPTSYANSNLSPSKHHSSESSNKFGLDSPKYKNSNDASSYVNRENEHSSSGSHTSNYSSPPKYGFSSGSSSGSSSGYQESPKYKKQHDATSYVNRENDHYKSHSYDDSDDDEVDDDEDEYVPPIRSTTAAPTYTFKPRTSRIPYTTKYTTPAPVYLEPEEIKSDIIHSKFNIKHPIPSNSPTALGDLEDDEEYVAIPIPKKSKTSPIKFPAVKTKTTYSYSEHVDTKPFDSADHLENFDTTKLFDDYHKNQPSLSKLPVITATKFTIDDVADPYKPKYTSVDYNTKQSNKASIPIEEFQPSFKLQEGSLYALDTDDAANKEFQKLLLAQQDQFGEDHVRLQLAQQNKAASSLGQYQQYLKSKEDEQLEQQFLREQLKLQEQQQKRRPLPSYARPFNKYHPGRRPPKRPSKTGPYRTTIKIPYGFHFRL